MVGGLLPPEAEAGQRAAVTGLGQKGPAMHGIQSRLEKGKRPREGKAQPRVTQHTVSAAGRHEGNTGLPGGRAVVKEQHPDPPRTLLFHRKFPSDTRGVV